MSFDLGPDGPDFERPKALLVKAIPLDDGDERVAIGLHGVLHLAPVTQDEHVGLGESGIESAVVVVVVVAAEFQGCDVPAPALENSHEGSPQRAARSGYREATTSNLAAFREENVEETSHGTHVTLGKHVVEPVVHGADHQAQVRPPPRPLFLMVRVEPPSQRPNEDQSRLESHREEDDRARENPEAGRRREHQRQVFGNAVREEILGLVLTVDAKIRTHELVMSLVHTTEPGEDRPASPRCPVEELVHDVADKSGPSIKGKASEHSPQEIDVRHREKLLAEDH
jgi:hypothetical protein